MPAAFSALGVYTLDCWSAKGDRSRNSIPKSIARISKRNNYRTTAADAFAE